VPHGCGGSDESSAEVDDRDGIFGRNIDSSALRSLFLGDDDVDDDDDDDNALLEPRTVIIFRGNDAMTINTHSSLVASTYPPDIRPKERAR